MGRHGYAVTCAPDGDAGLELLQQHEYDICALDHYMPARDGLDVLPDILALNAPPPVVYVTGTQDGRIAVAALRAGAADYVIKDVSEDFTSLLRSALEYLFSSEVRANGPLLILLDLNLPDMSGTDILAQVKADERLRRAPVVVLTTTDDKVEIQRCYDLGCNVYITKPVDYESFADAIRQLGLFLSVMQSPDIE